MSSSQDIFSKYDKWHRLVMLLEKGGMSVCKYILHTEMGVPIEGHEMHKYLQRYAIDIERSKMFPYQKKIFLNKDGNIDTTKLGLTLYIQIIEVLDKNKEYPLICWLRFNSNELLNMNEVQRNMSEKEFDDRWNELSRLLKDLNCDLSSLQSLKHVNRFPNEDGKETLDDIVRKGSVRKFISLCEYQYEKVKKRIISKRPNQNMQPFPTFLLSLSKRK